MTTSTLDPHTYAVAAQFVAAHAAQSPGLYVSVSPYGIEVQGDPRCPITTQLDVFRSLAARLGAQIEDHQDRVRFDLNYDGVPVQGFLRTVPEVGRTDEVRNDVPVVVDGAA